MPPLEARSFGQRSLCKMPWLSIIGLMAENVSNVATNVVMS